MGYDCMELRVTLRDIEPPIWRRFTVAPSITLDELHYVLQGVMGWWDCHLHGYRFGGVDYSPGDPETIELGISERGVALDSLVTKASDRFEYCYDYGDDWIHDLEVVALRPKQKRERIPGCLAGARACPPEDCGGPGAYAELIQVAADPNHEQHEALFDWLDEHHGDFDPEEFDLAAAHESVRGFG